jgi:hypothetical protein
MITGKATLSCPVSAVTIKVAIEATESDHQREGADLVNNAVSFMQTLDSDNLRAVQSSKFSETGTERFNVEP